MPKTKTKQGDGAKKGNGAKKPNGAGDEALVAMGSHADYDAFRSEAEQLDASEVVRMRVDLVLLHHNAKAGVASVLAERERLEALPETDVEAIETLPRVVLATIFADTQIDRSAPPSVVQAKLARSRELRDLLLSVAEGLAKAGLIPVGHVEKIRAGKGQIDTARDCVELAALFGTHAAKIRGKHPVSAAQIKEAAQTGTELLGALKPGRARRSPSGAAPGQEMRDRLYTLALHRYDVLWRAGAYLFGQAGLDTKVPALQANRGGRPKKASAPQGDNPAPAPPTG